jgi:hypothetical protein
VFELLNDVFFEKNHFYSYFEIEKNSASRSQEKTNKLLFRLANYFDCEKIMLIGENETVKKCLSLVNSKTNIYQDKKGYNNKLKDIKQIDLFYICSDKLNYINHLNIDICHENTVIVLEDIHKNIKNKNIWKNICQAKMFDLTVDIFSFGIVFIKNNFNKQNYTVAF